MAAKTVHLNKTQLKRKITRLVNAAIQESWKGSQTDAESIEMIEQELEAAKRDLDLYLQANEVREQ